MPRFVDCPVVCMLVLVSLECDNTVRNCICIMYSFPVCLFRHFRHFDIIVRQRPLRLSCKNFRSQTILAEKVNVFKEKISDDHCNFFKDTDDIVSRADIKEVVKRINKFSSPESIKWEKVTKELNLLNIKNTKKVIILTCVRLEKLDVGVSYYNYLIEKKEELIGTELIHFITLLAKCEDRLPKFREFVKNLYEKMKDYLFGSTFIKLMAFKVFVNCPDCFWDCVEDARKSTERKGNHPIVLRAFEINQPEIGWEFAKDHDFKSNTEFLKVYVDYLVQRAMEGRFSVDMINDLVNICWEKMWFLNISNFKFSFAPLVRALELKNNGYTLSVNNCEINSQNVCSNCGLALQSRPMSKKSLEVIKNEFFKYVLCKNIDLHSSFKEVNEFKSFLDNCNPYNCVLDGLNLLYAGKGCGMKIYQVHLRHFLENNFKVLVIGRHHSKGFLTKPLNTMHSSFKRNVQFFFTSNMSDDDRFTLYSAMHGGPNTYFCSGDHLNPYSVNLSHDTEILFQKWKISHQYLIVRRSLFHPWPHMGLPQMTASPNKEGDSYVWHFSHALSESNLSHSKKVNWSCVKAIPRT